MTDKLIVIGGPTASGKTALSIAMAQRFDGEIISADSRQFYRRMDIGTAKPNAHELAQTVHHCFNIRAIDEPLSAGEFEQLALQLIADINARGKMPIMVGGSGLYLQAVLQGLNTFPEIPQQVKGEIEAKFQEGGLEWMRTELERLDPVHAQKVDIHNPARLRRALEVCLGTGRPYSSFLGAPSANRPFRSIQFLPHWPREVLYDRINARVDQMIQEGLEEEVRALLPYRNCTTLNTIGYEEWFPYFDGLVSRVEVIEKIKQYSRNYAKRQLTWFKKYGGLWRDTTNWEADIEAWLGEQQDA